MTTSATTLTWAVKESLVRYVSGLEDGEIQTTSPAERFGNVFQFQLDEEASDFSETNNSGTLQFRGSLILTGHWGSMRVELTDPKLVTDGGALEVQTRTINPISGDRFETIARGTLVSDSDSAESLGKVTLTAAGRMIFGEQYQVGQELSDLYISGR